MFPPGFHPLAPRFGFQENTSSPLRQVQVTSNVYQISVRTSATSDFAISCSAHPPPPGFSFSLGKTTPVVAKFSSASSFLSKTTDSPNSLQDESFFYFPPSSLCKKEGELKGLWGPNGSRDSEKRCGKAVHSGGIYSWSGDSRPSTSADQTQTRPGSPSSWAISAIPFIPTHCLTLSLGSPDWFFFLAN